MRLRTTSSAIATGSMAASSRADCAPWASGTSLPHQPRPGFAERLIGSIRRECVDHIIVLGEMHLRRVLKSYADYYNCVRARVCCSPERSTNGTPRTTGPEQYS